MEDRKMTSKSRAWSFVLILGTVLLSPLMAYAVTFQYGKPITIDHTKVPATLTNFPILVSIANDNDLKNHVTSPNGYDLVFTDGSGNPLDHELERWDGATGTLVAWVRIPSLDGHSDKHFVWEQWNNHLPGEQDGCLGFELQGGLASSERNNSQHGCFK